MDEIEIPYKKASPIKAIFLFFFMPQEFAKMSVDHDISYLISKDRDARNRYKEGSFDEEREVRNTRVELQAKNIKKSFYSSMLLVASSALLALVIGAMIGHVLDDEKNFVITTLQIIGAALLLWGAIW